MIVIASIGICRLIQNLNMVFHNLGKTTSFGVVFFLLIGNTSGKRCS
jgi:hypothetical protein